MDRTNLSYLRHLWSRNLKNSSHLEFSKISNTASTNMFCISKASLQWQQSFHIISVAVQHTQLKRQGKICHFFAILPYVKIWSLFRCQIRKYSIYRHILYIKRFLSVTVIFLYNFCCITTHTTENTMSKRSFLAILEM